MKLRSIINDSTLNTPDSIEANVPPWYSKLCAGSLFGKRKDALILRIMDMGGMGFLESECGFAFYPGDKEPPCEPTLRELLSLERRLHKEQAAAEKLLRSASMARVEVVSSGKGMMCLKVSSTKPG
jgi:hypothetical protein